MRITRSLLVLALLATPAVADPLQATHDGVWTLKAAKPVTAAGIKKAMPKAESMTLHKSERRGAARYSMQIGSDGVYVEAYFAAKTGKFLWLELTQQDGQTCVDGVCTGDALANAKALLGDTCTANADGQGFSATFSCAPKGARLIVLATLPDATRQDSPLGQATAPIKVDDMIAAKATVAGFVWLAPKATWAPSRYDEGDR